MRVNETTLRPASFLEREVRRICITEVSQQELVQLRFELGNLFFPYARQRCKLEVVLANTVYYINSEHDLCKLIEGFDLAVKLVDPGFRMRADDYAANNLKVQN